MAASAWWLRSNRDEELLWIGGRFEDWDEERFRSDTYCGCGGRVDRTDFCFLDIRFFTSIHLKLVFFLPVVLMLLVIVDRFRSYCLRDEELSRLPFGFRSYFAILSGFEVVYIQAT